MWDGHEGMGWWMLLGSIWFVVFWGFVIWAAFALIGRLDGTKGQANREEPLEIAKRRYARGEISKEEYDVLRADLL
jgi:putative membrane protein